MTTVAINPAKAQKIINYTNAKLAAWYQDAKAEYGVNGSALARFDAEAGVIIIDAIEDGVRFSHTEYYWMDEAINYTFDVWCESASAE